MRMWWTLSTLGLALGLAGGCGGEQAAPSGVQADAQAKSEAPAPKEAKRPEGPLPALLVSQAQFFMEQGRVKPGPAKLVIWRTDGERWFDEVLEDEGSNVFHKAMWWNDGILTIAAGQIGFDPPKPAQLRHWRKSGDTWEPTTLWEQTWGGKFQRLRDIELGDLDGDGKDDMAIATHDMGVVAVGRHGADGTWTFVEMDQQADTFVHEIEIGDVDGDGKNEFYATPSARNKASGESQPGGVVRYDYKDGKFVRSEVVSWEETHAKEILVHDVDGDGVAELYVVREAHTVKDGGKIQVKEPVKLLRMEKQGQGWKETVVAEIDDQQARFLVPGDVNHDGKTDLLLAGYKSGLWLLELQEDGSFAKTLIDPTSSGFEHATHVADLNDDGKLEIYVASDDQKELRRYEWTGKDFERTRISGLPERHITWNIQDARL